MEHGRTTFTNFYLRPDNTTDIDVEIEQVSELHPEISTAEFFAEEANIALKAMKPDKSPGLDGLTLNLWKLPKVRTYLKHFCIEKFKGYSPEEWGLSGIVPDSAQKGKSYHLYQL